MWKAPRGQESYDETSHFSFPVQLQDIHLKGAFKSSTSFDQQVVSRATMPKAMQELYEACDRPPPLDKLNPYRSETLSESPNRNICDSTRCLLISGRTASTVSSSTPIPTISSSCGVRKWSKTLRNCGKTRARRSVAVFRKLSRVSNLTSRGVKLSNRSQGKRVYLRDKLALKSVKRFAPLDFRSFLSLALALVQFRLFYDFVFFSFVSVYLS